MTAEDFLERLEGVKKVGGGWVAKCPSHEDHQASLQVSEREDGSIGVFCHAGCDVKKVVKAMGLTLAHLFNDSPEKKRTPIDTDEYPYVDEQGTLLYTVVRGIDERGKKTFRQRKADGTWGIEGVRRVLYRLPEVMAAVGKRRIFVVEGEKDVNRLFDEGEIATCNSGGAGKWQPEYSMLLEGAHVRIVADKDDPGRAHAESVRDSLSGVAASVKIVEAREGKDAYDHFEAGWGANDFVEVTGLDGVAMIRAADVAAEEVEWIPGFENMIAYGALSSLLGMPGVNKSTFACYVASRITQEGFAAGFIGGEDALAEVVRPRLEAAGADLTKCYFIRMADHGQPAFPRDARAVAKNVRTHGIRFLVIDPIEAHLEHHIDPYKNSSVRGALLPLVTMAEEEGCAVLMIQHMNKDKSSQVIMRAGGSIGIPGISRSAMLMGNDPEHELNDGIRLVAVYKGNWAQHPKAKVYHVDTRFIEGLEEPQVTLVTRGEHPFADAKYILREHQKGHS